MAFPLNELRSALCWGETKAESWKLLIMAENCSDENLSALMRNSVLCSISFFGKFSFHSPPSRSTTSGNFLVVSHELWVSFLLEVVGQFLMELQVNTKESSFHFNSLCRAAERWKSIIIWFYPIINTLHLKREGINSRAGVRNETIKSITNYHKNYAQSRGGI